MVALWSVVTIATVVGIVAASLFAVVRMFGGGHRPHAH